MVKVNESGGKHLDYIHEHAVISVGHFRVQPYALHRQAELHIHIQFSAEKGMLAKDSCIACQGSSPALMMVPSLGRGLWRRLHNSYTK